MQTIQNILKSKNLKITPQRLAIYNLLYNTDTHPNAELIYKSIQEQYPSMSLATVYKTLDSFKKVGLVQELNVGEDSFRYDANYNDHMHLICENCNSIVDVPELCELESAVSDIACDRNFNISRKQLFFYGVCNKCS